MPVITGKERGIVSACTYEAKRLGVKRGMKLHEARAVCPDAVILPSDYETYSLFSERMYEIVRRYTPSVEEYSIDECFADLTGMRRALHLSYPEMAAGIKRDLEVELGMSFSVGLSATKVLAKIGSKWQKPSGLTLIPLRDAHTFLEATPVGKVWGIGPNTASYLNKFGVRSAWDLTQKDEAWVREKLSKPYREIWHELNGRAVLALDTEGRRGYQSISKTKTFTPPSTDACFIFSQLSKNIENACIKARRWGLAAPAVFFFLKTQDFRYHGCELKLTHPTASPQDILHAVRDAFPRIFRERIQYRATGITLLKLVRNDSVQLDLFGAFERSSAIETVMRSADEIAARYGKHAVYLASSMEAVTHAAHLGARGDVPKRVETLFKGETSRRRLNIPMLGEVS